MKYLWNEEINLKNPFSKSLEKIPNLYREIFTVIYDDNDLNNIDILKLIPWLITLREDIPKLFNNFVKVSLQKPMSYNSIGYFRIRFSELNNSDKLFNYINIYYSLNDLVKDNNGNITDEVNSQVIFPEGSYLWKVKRVWDHL